MSQKVAIVGSGPSALMTADRLSEQGFRVSLFEKRGAIGRKLFIAGSSGLNVTHALPASKFGAFYKGSRPDFWSQIFDEFGPHDWIQFLETKLGEKTFLGTSGRYFVRSMTAVGMVRAWKKRLAHIGVQFHMNHEWIGMKKLDIEESTLGMKREMNQGVNDPKSQDVSECSSQKIILEFLNGHSEEFDAVCLCLGGGSWETENPLRWPEIFKKMKIEIEDFKPTNTGWQVDLPPKFFKEAEGEPLKNISFSSSLGAKKGDLVVTSYGLEGTPVYFLGEQAVCYIDLKPDLTEKAVLERLFSVKENMSAFRRVKKTMKLSRASESLIYHVAITLGILDLPDMAKLIKKLPIRLIAPRPLSESISSSGGVSFDELDQHMMLKKIPGVFLAGEMLNWDAPTGGFLIQGCISMAAAVSHQMTRYLGR